MESGPFGNKFVVCPISGGTPKTQVQGVALLARNAHFARERRDTSERFLEWASQVSCARLILASQLLPPPRTPRPYIRPHLLIVLISGPKMTYDLQKPNIFLFKMIVLQYTYLEIK